MVSLNFRQRADDPRPDLEADLGPGNPDHSGSSSNQAEGFYENLLDAQLGDDDDLDHHSGEESDEHGDSDNDDDADKAQSGRQQWRSSSPVQVNEFGAHGVAKSWSLIILPRPSRS